MNLTENDQAILLLSTYFSSAKRGEPTPLTAVEYGRFALWLHSQKLAPMDLVSEFESAVAHWQDPKGRITRERLDYLLGRGVAMGLALEKWRNAGIWILTRADSAYPKRLKRMLGADAPAVLFGVGDQSLLSHGGLAMVGSRNVLPVDEQYAESVAQVAASEGMSVVSGGARGVDETAMLAALNAEGTSVGILANGLFKAALSRKWRAFLKGGQLCLVSMCSPEASFHVGNAMGRNKYIYCLADNGLVVRADEGKGGTWAGATEALRKRFGCVFVNPYSDADGNAALLAMGALALPLPASGSPQTSAWLSHALASRPASWAVSEATPDYSSKEMAVELPEEGADGDLSDAPEVEQHESKPKQEGLFDDRGE